MATQTFKSNGITGVYNLIDDNIPEMIQDFQNEKLEYNRRLLIAGNVDLWF